MDKLSKQKRSWNMSRIRRSNTKPELLVRKYLYSQGYRYRINTNIYGKPDVVFHSKKIAIFVNGCFWHKHERCRLSYIPKTNTAFWKRKLLGNLERDKKVSSELVKNGWKVVQIWECDIETDFQQTIGKVIKIIN